MDKREIITPKDGCGECMERSINLGGSQNFGSMNFGSMGGGMMQQQFQQQQLLQQQQQQFQLQQQFQPKQQHYGAPGAPGCVGGSCVGMSQSVNQFTGIGGVGGGRSSGESGSQNFGSMNFGSTGGGGMMMQQQFQQQQQLQQRQQHYGAPGAPGCVGGSCVGMSQSVNQSTGQNFGFGSFVAPPQQPQPQQPLYPQQQQQFFSTSCSRGSSLPNVVAVSVHVHPLTMYGAIASSEVFWRCDGWRFPGSHHPKDHLLPNSDSRWSCVQCNFDLCSVCAAKYQRGW